jgi:hypothetical protein
MVVEKKQPLFDDESDEEEEAEKEQKGGDRETPRPVAEDLPEAEAEESKVEEV